MKPSDNALERGLPQAPEAERMIFGCILQAGNENGANELFVMTAAVLSPDDFASEAHRTIFAGMQALDTLGRPIEPTTVSQWLIEHRHTERIGGLDYIAGLWMGCPRLSSIESYVSAVKDKSTLRRIIFTCRDISNRCIENTETATEVLSHGESILASLNSASSKTTWQNPGEVMRNYPGGFDAFVNPSKGGSGVQSPWPRLNAMLCGFQKKELILLAARPSMGKSAAALQIAYHAAKHGVGVAYLSLEMSKESLTRRLICMAGGIDSHMMRNGWLTSEQRRKAAAAAFEIESLPIWIEDGGSWTAPAIRSTLRRLRSEHEYGLIIVDHFHLVDGIGREETRDRYSRIADSFQRYAKDFDMPFMPLCQLNRGPESEKRAPQLSDLKETGNLEQNADVVIFIHRPEMFNKSDIALRGLAYMIVAKQRNGPIGKLDMDFHHGTQSFKELERQETEAA